MPESVVDMIHFLDTEVAAEMGIPCAVILQNLYYWMKQNEANEQHCHDGKYWTYNTQQAFCTMFPYLTAKQIRNAIDKLLEAGFIEKGNYNSNPMDRTTWYTVTLKGQMQLPQRANGNAPQGECIDIYNDNNIYPNNKPYNNILGDSDESQDKDSQSSHPSDDEFFESIWKLYPRKKGKGSVSKTQKKKLHKLGYDVVSQCIERYKDYNSSHGIDEQFVMYGSSFFNKGYLDYLPDVESPSSLPNKTAKGGGWE